MIPGSPHMDWLWGKGEKSLKTPLGSKSRSQPRLWPRPSFTPRFAQLHLHPFPTDLAPAPGLLQSSPIRPPSGQQRFSSPFHMALPYHPSGRAAYAFRSPLSLIGLGCPSSKAAPDRANRRASGKTTPGLQVWTWHTVRSAPGVCLQVAPRICPLGSLG